MLGILARRALTASILREATPVICAAVPKTHYGSIAPIPWKGQDPDTDRFGYYQHPDEDLTKVPHFHKVILATYQSDLDKLKVGKWPWPEGIRGRLPEHYKQRYLLRYTTTPIPVHYKPDARKWKQDKHGLWTDVENVPIPILFPKEADRGLWGGEGLVVGWRKKHAKLIKPKTPRIWKPKFVRRVFYSEILDEHMAITCTLRLLDLVDQACGFDHYILATQEVDMKSALGMTLRRHMLHALHEKSQGDPERRGDVYGKYDKYVIPSEEIDWLGLTIDEAVKKQEDIEEEDKRRNALPMKEMLARELIDKLQNPDAYDSDEPETAQSGWMEKLNPFQKK